MDYLEDDKNNIFAFDSLGGPLYERMKPKIPEDMYAVSINLDNTEDQIFLSFEDAIEKLKFRELNLMFMTQLPDILIYRSIAEDASYNENDFIEELDKKINLTSQQLSELKGDIQFIYVIYKQYNYIFEYVDKISSGIETLKTENDHIKYKKYNDFIYLVDFLYIKNRKILIALESYLQRLNDLKITRYDHHINYERYEKIMLNYFKIEGSYKDLFLYLKKKWDEKINYYYQ